VFRSQTFAKQHKRAARRAGFCFVAEAVNDLVDIEWMQLIIHEQSLRSRAVRLTAKTDLLLSVRKAAAAWNTRRHAASNSRHSARSAARVLSREVVMAEIPCVSVAIMQSTTVKTHAENSELLLKNFAIPGKSVAMPDGQDICQKDRESDRRLPDLAHDGTSRKLFE
jgi:hypothetical protein